MTIGEKIQICRKKKGMSQEDLANVLNVSRQAVQKWESGTSKPEINKIVQLSSIFDVTADWLLKDGEIENSINNEIIEKAESSLNNNNTQYHPGEKHLDPKRIKTIKIWMIIGCVLTPAIIGGSYINNQYKPEACLFLLLYLVTIPLCVFAIKKCKTAKDQNDLIKIGVACILFVSVIGGVLMVSSGDKYFVYDKPKTKEELEAEESKRLEIEKQLQLEKERIAEEQRKKEAEEKERKRILSLRENKKMQIASLCSSFCAKKYHPSDKRKAEVENINAYNKIDLLTTDDEMTEIVNSYKAFLSSFEIDIKYYEDRKRKIKKFFAIFVPCVSLITIAAILTGTVFVPLGKYNYAMSLISEGKYEEADKYLDNNSWGDSKTQITINKARAYFDSDNYEKGINVLYSLGSDIHISYNLNGGEGKDSDVIKKRLYVDNIPNKNGYSFEKWSVESYSIGGSHNQYKTELELKALWRIRNYAITYNLNGGTHNNPDSYTIEAEDFTLNYPVKPGYKFIGWTGTDIDKPIKDLTIKKGSFGELSLSANWDANNYTIHLDSDGGECIVDTMAVSFDSEYELPFPTKIGYEFIGWFEDDNKWESGTWKRTSDLYLKAKWNIKEFNISFDLHGGSIDNFPEKYTYFDEDILINDPIRIGYEFTGWLGTGLTEKTKNLIICQNSLGDREYDAYWEGLTYTVQFDTNGGIMDVDSMVVNYDENCELPLPTRIGYTFKGWHYNSNYVESGIWKIPDDVTLTATWEVTNYNLTIELDGGSISPVPPTTYTYFDDTIVISNPTRTGYTFTGWKNLDNDEITVSNLTIPANSIGDKSYIALWNGITYHLTFDPNEGACDTTEMDVVFGNNVTLPTPTRTGYDFNGWWVDGVSIVYDGEWKINRDVSLVAKWRQTPSASSYPSLSWGYYPQNVEENSSIISDLNNASDIDGDGYLEYSGNKYAKSYCYTNTGRKSDSGSTTFSSGILYYFKVSAIAWLGVPDASSSTSTSAALHTRKVLDRRSFGSSNSYSSSSIKTYLEGSFYDSVFTSFEKKKATNPRLPSTPNNCYDGASGSGYPTDYAVCRGVALETNSKKTVYWVTKTSGTDVCMAITGEWSSGYSTYPSNSVVGVRPIITFKFK